MSREVNSKSVPTVVLGPAIPTAESADSEGHFCCSRFLRDLRSEINPCQRWFRVEERSTGRVLDIPESFSPASALAFFCKICSCSFVFSSQVHAWVRAWNDMKSFYSSFGAWALVLAFFYSIASLLNTAFPPSQRKETHVPIRIKLTWITFALAIFSQGLATLLFWAFAYQGRPLEYLDVSLHGFVFMMIFIDGFFVNIIPLRWMFIWMCWAAVVFFVACSVILGHDNNTNAYGELSWQSGDVPKSILFVVIIFVVFVPLVFGVLRSISISMWPFCCIIQDRRIYVLPLPVSQTHKNDEELQNQEILNETESK